MALRRAAGRLCCSHTLCVFPRGMDAPSLSHAQLEPWLQLPELLPPAPPQSTFKRLKHLNTHTLVGEALGKRTKADGGGDKLPSLAVSVGHWWSSVESSR